MSKTTLQWLSLVGVIWLQSVNGTNTNFPAYSSHLKQLLSLSQLQLNNLAFASDAGKLFGFLSGIAALYLPLWLVLFIGSALGLVGYGVQYLFLENYIHCLSYTHIFLLTVLAGNSICWINTVCYVVAIRNFPGHQQLAVGLTASYQGLSAKIYTVLVEALFVGASSVHKGCGYLLLNSILPLLVSTVAGGAVRDLSVHGRDDDVDDGDFNAKNSYKRMSGGFIVMFGITIATGVYAISSSLRSMSSGSSSIGNAMGILVFLLAPLAIPLVVKVNKVLEGKQKRVHSEFTLEEHDNNIHVNGSVIVAERMEAGAKEEERNDNRKEVDEHELVGHVKEEIGVKVMLKRVDFWLYFFVYLSGATLGLVYLNNLGQIAESRGCLGTSSLVALSSSFGFFGRLVPSLLDYFLSR